jgi:hypothetical protein
MNEGKTSIWKLVSLTIIGATVVTWFMVPGAESPSIFHITAAEYGDKWPLIATDATLGCESPTKAYVEIGGRRCGLNGKAIKSGMARCDDAARSGNAADITMAFVDRALTLCASRQ